VCLECAICGDDCVSPVWRLVGANVVDGTAVTCGLDEERLGLGF